MTKASIASISVIQRCFQIVPSANHLTTRAATSTGLEKKNGGSSVTPPIGTVVSTCHATTEMTAMRSCNERSLTRDTIKLLPSCLMPAADYGLENVAMMPVEPLTWPSSAFGMSSRVRPGCSAVGSRSVAISTKV